MKFTFLFLMLLGLAPLAAQNIATAERYYKNRQWPEAIAEYQKITNANPYHGGYWHRLGYALLKNNQWSAAIAAFETARPLLAFSRNATYNIACCYALSGQKEKAIAWLKLAYDEGYNNIHSIRTDDDLISIRNSREFAAIFNPHPPEGLSRDEQWLFDIDYLVRVFENKHFDLYHDLSKEKWQLHVHELKEKVPALTNGQIVGELMKLVALVKDGHSNIFPANGQLYFPATNGHGNVHESSQPSWQPHVIPFHFEWFDDGVFIVEADLAHARLVGARIIKAGQMDIEKLMDQLLLYIGKDNQMQGKMMGVKLLRLKELYEWEGIIKSGNDISFTLALPDGKEEVVVIEPHPIAKDKNIRWSKMNDTASQPVPLYLQQPDKYYWYRYLQKEKIVWLQYNAVQNQHHGPTLESFAKEMFHFIENNEVEALVIDVRNNMGGNSFFNQSIVHRVIQSQKINQKGRLFVITGWKTFSAAMNFATDMEKMTPALFVGERTGSRPNFYGEHNPFQLPFSKVQGSYSSHYFQNGFSSQDHRPWIAPDLIATLSSVDFRNNNDPALEAIMRYMEKQ